MSIIKIVKYLQCEFCDKEYNLNDDGSIPKTLIKLPQNSSNGVLWGMKCNTYFPKPDLVFCSKKCLLNYLNETIKSDEDLIIIDNTKTACIENYK